MKKLLIGAFALTLVPTTLLASSPNEERSWTAQQATTELAFRPGTFPVKLEITEVRQTAEPLQHHALSHAPEGMAFVFHAPAPWGLSFTAPHGHLRSLVGGSLRHLGQLRLSWPGGSVELTDFEVRPGPGEQTLDVFSRDGRHLFHADHLHHDLDAEAGRLRIFNADLRITEELAELIGELEITGTAIGVLSIEAEVEVPEPMLLPEGAPPSCSDWSGSQDVALINVSSIQQIARAGGKVVVTPSARLKNVGTANVPWHSKFSTPAPPYNNDQHPFLVWALYRELDGVFEQLGRSDVKHAFLTINVNCDAGACTDGHILGLGCEDVYGVGTNSSNGSLGPWEEISAETGIWAHCDEPVPNTPSHFDTDGNCVQDHSGQGEDAFSHGLVVEEAELGVAGARYFFHSWYVVRDDVDIFNTMGWYEVTPSFNGAAWIFTQIAPGGLPASPPSAFRSQGSALDAWVDPVTPPSGSSNTRLKVGRAYVQLASKVTSQSGEDVIFAWALANHDFDRRLDSFEVPIPSGLAIRSTGFNDLDQDPGNDWTVSVLADRIRWEAPTAAEAQDWHTTLTFTLETDSLTSPEGSATVTVADPGSPSSVPLATLTPGQGNSIFADGFESGNTAVWTAVNEP